MRHVLGRFVKLPHTYIGICGQAASLPCDVRGLAAPHGCEMPSAQKVQDLPRKLFVVLEQEAVSGVRVYAHAGVGQ